MTNQDTKSIKKQMPLPVRTVVTDTYLYEKQEPYMDGSQRHTSINMCYIEYAYFCQNCKRELYVQGLNFDGFEGLMPFSGRKCKTCPDCGQKLWWRKDGWTVNG